jgi:glycosyltransferase involved in cell wall biosynthesis
VLYLAPSGSLGGAERVLVDLVHGVREQLQAGVLAFADGPLITQLRALGVPVWVVPLPAGLARLGEQSGAAAAVLGRLLRAVADAARPGYEFVREARRVVAAFAPDLVHSNGQKAHLLARLLCAQRPLIIHVHDFQAERVLSRHLLRVLARPPLTLLAVSKATAEDIAQLLPQAPLHIMYNAVDTLELSPGHADPAWLDALAGLPEAAGTPLRVGLVATYARWKGHDVFLRAAALLKDWGHAARFRFYVVGSPVYTTLDSQCTRAELTQLADQLGIRGHLGFVDFQQHVARVYNSLSVVVHASTRPEPFGRTIIEAMACGKPVVSSATGGAAELFTPGVSGLRSVPGSAGSLAAALLQLADDQALRDRLSRQGRSHVLSHFDRRRLPAQLLGIYSEALGAAGSG